MKARHVVLFALAATVTPTSVAAAGPDAAKQRVAIMTKGAANEFLIVVFGAHPAAGRSNQTGLGHHKS